MQSRNVQILSFFGKMMFFFEKILQSFNETQHGHFASVSDLKVFLAYAISKRSNLEFFWKNDVFLSKKSLKIFRSTMLGIFDLECVLDFQVAEEFSKQSMFWFFFGEKDLVFEKTLDFFQNRKTSHLFSSLRLK